MCPRGLLGPPAVTIFNLKIIENPTKHSHGRHGTRITGVVRDHADECRMYSIYFTNFGLDNCSLCWLRPGIMESVTCIWPQPILSKPGQICMGSLPTEDAYSSGGHLVLSHLGLAFVVMLRPFFPELVMSTDLLSFEHPLVPLFCLFIYQYEKRLLLRYIHHFKSDIINNTDHMHFTGTEPSSVILSQTK